MPERTIAEATADLTAHYDERTRLFNKLRVPTLSDADRQQTVVDYAAAAKAFDIAREEVIKLGRPTKTV